MKQLPYPIYVVEADPERAEGWRVVAWNQHSALLPRELDRHVVSTQAGDVELYAPFMPSLERNRLYAMFDAVVRLHPKPTDLGKLEGISWDALLTLALRFSLEYVGLAEDGRGHNERSRYLARCLRRIASLTEVNVVRSATSLDIGEVAFESGEVS